MFSAKAYRQAIEEMTQKMTQTIEGVPVGWKLVRFGKFRKGEYILNVLGDVFGPVKRDSEADCYPVIAPDNVYGQPLSEVEIPVGYEKAGQTDAEWFREPTPGESYVFFEGGYSHVPKDYTEPHHTMGPDHRRIILRPIKPPTRKVLVVEIHNPSAHEVKVIEDLIPDYMKLEERAV